MIHTYNNERIINSFFNERVTRGGNFKRNDQSQISRWLRVTEVVFDSGQNENSVDNGVIANFLL